MANSLLIATFQKSHFFTKIYGFIATYGNCAAHRTRGGVREIEGIFRRTVDRGEEADRPEDRRGGERRDPVRCNPSRGRLLD